MKTVKTKFLYADAGTRLYSFDCEDSLAADVKQKIKSINTSLIGGTDGGLSTFFVSDSGANLSIVESATIESILYEPLTIAPNS